MNKLSLLKLVSGEEVIAELYRDEENTEAWILFQPFTLLEVTVQGGAQGNVGFMLTMRPFFRALQPSAQQKISVDRKHILTQAEVPEALEKAYLQQRSGLDLSQAANSIVRPS